MCRRFKNGVCHTAVLLAVSLSLGLLGLLDLAAGQTQTLSANAAILRTQNQQTGTVSNYASGQDPTVLRAQLTSSGVRKNKINCFC